MTTRPDTAKKLLLYWMYGTLGLAWFMSLLFIVEDVSSGGLTVARAACSAVLATGFYALTPSCCTRPSSTARGPP
ncbi:hypothetical protein ACFQ0B_28980 [Nonomuraea thailandensis]